MHTFARFGGKDERFKGIAISGGGLLRSAQIAFINDDEHLFPCRFTSGSKGKKVGIVYRNKEWEYNGKTGWTTEAAGSDSVENIRAGKFYKFKDKFLPQKPVEAPTFEELDDSESDLPF